MITAEQNRTFTVDTSEFRRLERETAAERAGFASWAAAIEATSHLSQEQAGQVLGFSHATIHNWRSRLGVETKSPELTAEAKRQAFLRDLLDPRHGQANGYRNLRCRCRRCTDAWTAYLRDRKRASRARLLADVQQITAKRGKRNAS